MQTQGPGQRPELWQVLGKLGEVGLKKLTEPEKGVLQEGLRRLSKDITSGRPIEDIPLMQLKEVAEGWTVNKFAKGVDLNGVEQKLLNDVTSLIQRKLTGGEKLTKREEAFRQALEKRGVSFRTTPEKPVESATKAQPPTKTQETKPAAQTRAEEVKTIENIVKQGLTFKNTGRIDDAIKVFEEGMASHPNMYQLLIPSGGLHATKSTILENHGKFAEAAGEAEAAIDYYKQALTSKPPLDWTTKLSDLIRELEKRRKALGKKLK